MGVAAFVLAALTAVPYREVIIAALIPALAYYGCLFLAVVFQARKQNIEAIGEATEDMRLSRADYLYLVMIFAPILLIVVLLMTPKRQWAAGRSARCLAWSAPSTAGSAWPGICPSFSRWSRTRRAMPAARAGGRW